MRAALIASFLCIAAPCAAQPDSDQPLFPAGRDTCFAAGPIEHAGGRAGALLLVRQAAPDPISEAAAWDRMRVVRGLATEPHALPVWGAVTLRGEGTPRLAWLGCAAREDGSVRCGVDCDGGAVTLRPDGEGLALRNEGLVLGGTCGAPQRVFWRPGPHDTDFRLHRLDAAGCLRAAESLRPAFALQGRPVMARIAAGDRCFERRYDAGHLRRHPNQSVAGLRLTWHGFAAEEANLARMALSVTLRGGERMNQDLHCRPEGFALECIPQHGDGSLTLRRTTEGVALDTRGSEGALRQLGGHRLGADDTLFHLGSACGEGER